MFGQLRLEALAALSNSWTLFWLEIGSQLRMATFIAKLELLERLGIQILHDPEHQPITLEECSAVSALTVLLLLLLVRMNEQHALQECVIQKESLLRPLHVAAVALATHPESQTF